MTKQHLFQRPFYRTLLVQLQRMGLATIYISTMLNFWAGNLAQPGLMRTVAVEELVNNQRRRFFRGQFRPGQHRPE
jgi:hypothetical protein